MPNTDNIIAFKRLGSNDINITPFEANKSYTLTHSDYSGSGYSVIKCIFPEQGIYRRDIPPLQTNNYNPIQNNNQFDVHVSWYSLRHNNYQGSVDWDYNEPFLSDINTRRLLYCSASVLSIPQRKFGNSIKKGSVSITDKSSGYTTYIIDDSNSNLYDTQIQTSSIINNSNLLFYYGFNEKFSHNNLTDPYRTKCIDISTYNNKADVTGSVGFSNGIYTHGDVVSQSGYKADFSTSGSIVIKHKDQHVINHTDSFSLSLWIDIPDTQTDLGRDYNSILSKRTYDYIDVFDRLGNRNDTKGKDGYYIQYPYDIYIYNSNTSLNGKIGFSRYGGTSETHLTSSTILTGSQHHIIIQKSGSNIELYVDGQLDTITTDLVNGSIHNESNIYLGSLGNKSSYLSGSIDEIRLYNKTLSTDEVGYLYNNDFNTGSAYQTNNVGNVFYKSGIIVISDPRPKYKYLFNGNTDETGFSTSYKATVKIYEHEMVCRVNMKDFNVTSNDTVLIDPNKYDGITTDFAQSNSFSPYITTIGFYNSKYELLAVGKLARPIKKRSDVDMTLVCRFDI